MQLWYHQRRSYLARGAAREQVAFFSPTQLSSGVHWFTSASASVQAVVTSRRTSGASSCSSRAFCSTRGNAAGAGSSSTYRKSRSSQPRSRKWSCHCRRQDRCCRSEERRVGKEGECWWGG